MQYITRHWVESKANNEHMNMNLKMDMQMKMKMEKRLKMSGRR
jgi:hypothetical protein